MNAEQKLRATVKAAELLGLEYRIHDLSIALSVRLFNTEKWRGFNIFDSSADCLSIVKKLGEHLISIMPINGGSQWYHDGTTEKRHYDTYEEAVAAALLELE